MLCIYFLLQLEFSFYNIFAYTIFKGGIIMRLYITFGTNEYLQNIKTTYIDETMILLAGEEDNALLLHETEGDTVFKEGFSYEVLDAVGNINQAFFAVFNNIPVTDEGRTLFEYRFQQRARLIENEPGFIAIRVLRPLNSDTYIILTLWGSKEDFTNWQESKAYSHAHKTRGTSEGIDQESIFPRASYVTKYSVEKETNA
jgi:heme oxygenase (mycobilin-producing)